MTDKTDVPEENPVEVMDAAGLVRSLVTDIPELATFRELLRPVAALVAFKRMNQPVDSALNMMRNAGLSLASIAPGINAIRNTVRLGREQWARDFNELTGYNVQVADLETASQSELDEQETERVGATELRDRVLMLKGWYFPATPEEPVGLLQGWARKAREISSKPVFTPREVAPSNEMPGWKTPPKLNDDDPRIQTLVSQIDLFDDMRTMVGGEDVEKAFLALSNLTFKRDRVEALLNEAEKLCDEQIVQSSIITALVGSTKVEYMTRAAKYATADAIAIEALNYWETRTK